MNVSSIIRQTWPKCPAKAIERELLISRRQSWRIVSTGHVPASLMEGFLAAVDRGIEQNLLAMDQLAETVKAIRNERMVSRAATRRAQGASLAVGGDQDGGGGVERFALKRRRRFWGLFR